MSDAAPNPVKRGPGQGFKGIPGPGRPKGSKNKRALRLAKAVLQVQTLQREVANMFPGDGVAYLQSVYKDPKFPVGLRVDAAAKAAKYERPQYLAIQVRTDQAPADAKERRAQLRAELMRKLDLMAVPEPLQIEGTPADLVPAVPPAVEPGGVVGEPVDAVDLAISVEGSDSAE